MINIQCELAPKIDRPPKRVVQQRPVHLGFFSFFFEKRTKMPGIRNLNSKWWAARGGLVIGDETWHYYLFFFSNRPHLSTWSMNDKSFAKKPLTATPLVHCVAIPGMEEGGFDRSSWERKRVALLSLLPLLITIFSSMFVLTLLFSFLFPCMWLSRRKIHLVATPLAFHTARGWLGITAGI